MQSTIMIMAMVAFFAIYIIIGRITQRKVKTSEDFHIAGREMGFLPTALSTAATDMAVSGVIGICGLAYSVGIAGGLWGWVAIPPFIILGIFVVGRLRIANLTTGSEFLERRYNPTLRTVAAILHIISIGVGITAETLAVSYVMNTMTGLSQTFCVLITTVVFVAYAVMGGLRAVEYADVLQFFILMFSIIVALPYCLKAVGGWSTVESTLPASAFDIGALGISEPLGWIALCFILYGTNQHYLQRIFAAKNPTVARNAFLFTAGAWLVFGIIDAMIGMCASILFPGLENADLAYTYVLRDVVPFGVSILAMAGLFAAAMSTADSCLTACSTMFTVDIYKRLIKKDAKDAHYLMVTRIATAAVAGISLTMSFFMSNVIEVLVLSSLIYGAGILFPLLVGLFWKRGNAAGAISGFIVGSIMALVSNFWIYGQVPGLFGLIYPNICGALASLVVYVVVSLLTAPPGQEKLEVVSSFEAF
ncbi:sodium:solute symporter family protein [Candidatus Formimonas warabiya]|uniref:Sodium:solute symporter family protein n=1 Tax=Formimonas warabiya TaxID=1761012 RepID=A0A3G1KQY4_FORW1|nr:sodium:solute symporter family protein [Candidatus Formimonas warabiya]ATW24871.1 hypothetical protein DCMF_08895 [Candidatus Formimonas warabiya]